MIKRIGLWAFAGFAVAVCWAFIASTVVPHYYDLNRSMAVAITVPLSWIGRRQGIPMTYYQSILMNAATYALLGLAVEPFLRRHRSHPSN
ncbi:MAG TPA: hypothetical protein VMA34_19275 [Terracidiphilus sp.]|nr:hypothetical protein [Terracidiphilus sp.]